MTKQESVMKVWNKCVKKAKEKHGQPTSYGMIKGAVLKTAQKYFCAQGK